mmetsp:Transcript_147993/g.368841  ORF Transcript_147993/g.368841 Transcript_147993/m.368841 type:complete len:332 (+) Transcript_147993:588-1583(+)
MLHDLRAAGNDHQLCRVCGELFDDLFPQEAEAELLACDQAFYDVACREAFRQPPSSVFMEVRQAKLLGKPQDVLVDLCRGRLVLPSGARPHAIHVAERDAHSLSCVDLRDLQLEGLRCGRWLPRVRARSRRGCRCGSLGRCHRCCRCSLLRQSRSRPCCRCCCWRRSRIATLDRGCCTRLGGRRFRRGAGNGCRGSSCRSFWDYGRQQALHGVGLRPWNPRGALGCHLQVLPKVVAHRCHHGLVRREVLPARHERHVAELAARVERPEAVGQGGRAARRGLHGDGEAHGDRAAFALWCNLCCATEHRFCLQRDRAEQMQVGEAIGLWAKMA